MINNLSVLLFEFDRFAMLMIALVFFIGLSVCSFARRYMKGDAMYDSFFIQIIILLFSVSIMVSADNLIVFFVAWCLSNMLLVRLMIHKSSWKPAAYSGMLAAKNYLFGAFCIGSAFVVLYLVTGECSIRLIVHEEVKSGFTLLALALILIGAMTQSAIWPFHRWLISSLNSPTPVSAMMHAGLVNGGGVLLLRFAPLYLQSSMFLGIIFVIGFATAMVGTFWNLMQSDVKRMLAFSTVGQMGFMFVQCSLGLFPAAVAHLIWHGIFKAYLFFASGSAAQQKRFDFDYPPKPIAFIGALLCGFAGSFSFAYVCGKSWLAGDSTLVLMVVAFLAATQFALPILQFKTLKVLPLALIATFVAGFFYGCSIELIVWIMKPMQLMQPYPLNILHILGIVILVLAWLSILFFKSLVMKDNVPLWVLRGYVFALNACQPHSKTVTTYRNQYKYE